MDKRGGPSYTAYLGSCVIILVDFLDGIFPLDESILNAMTGLKQPWEEMHHPSYFLPYIEWIEFDDLK